MNIDETYIEYDGPRLFRCHVDAGETYLGFWCEQAPQHDRWLLVPITAEEQACLEIGLIHLREFVQQAASVLIITETDADVYQLVLPGSEVPDYYLCQQQRTECIIK